MEWDIKIWEDGSSREAVWKNTSFSYSNGCARFFIHDFANGMEYEFWVDLSKEDTAVLFDKLGLAGLDEEQAHPIVLDKIPNNQREYEKLCKSFGLNPTTGSWVTTE